MRKIIVMCSLLLLSNLGFTANPPFITPEKYDSGVVDQIFKDIYRQIRKLELSTDTIDRKIVTTETRRITAYEIMATPSGNQTATDLESALNAQSVTIYNLTMSTIAGAVDWTAATTTFVNVTGDTMTGALKTIYYFQVSSTVAGLKRIEWADGSVSTFAVTGGATSADLTAYKTLVAGTTNWIGISTGTERTERIAADNEIKLSTGTLLPLDGSKAMTGNLNMGTKNITATSTHTVNTLNVTQINWADGQVSSTSHIGDLTVNQADARYKRGLPCLLIAAANAPQFIKNAADFTCDGTNDNDEFNAAISSLSTTGGIIDGANGYFAANGYINISGSSITLKNFRYTNVGFYGTSIRLDTGTINILLENIVIYSPNTADDGVIECDNFVGMRDIVLNNVVVFGGSNTGIYFDLGNTITLNNCSVKNADYGFKIIRSSNVIVSNCRALDCTGCGYFFEGNTNILNDNNLINNNLVNVLDFSIVASSGYLQGYWITPTLLNSWVNYGGDWSVAGYYKDNEGIVHLRGNVKNGISNNVFILPAGYRPEYRTVFPIVRYDGANFLTGDCEVLTDGTVMYTVYSTVSMSLDGIAFRAFQ